MYYLEYEAIPNVGNPEYGRLGGAFVNCWVNTDSQMEAEEIACEAIERCDWTIVSLEDSQLVDEANFEYSREAIEYIRQAEIDGDVCVFYTYPIDSDEELSN